MSVKPFLLNEFVMSSLFLYPAVLQDDDAVGIFYGLEPVSYGNDGASFIRPSSRTMMRSASFMVLSL